MKSTKKVAGIVFMVVGIAFSINSFLSTLLSLIELKNDVAEQYVFLEGHEPFYLGYILGLILPILIGMVVAVIGFFLYRSSTKVSREKVELS